MPRQSLFASRSFPRCLSRSSSCSRSEARSVLGDDAERVAAVAAVARRRRDQCDAIAGLDHTDTPPGAVIVVAAMPLELDVARAFFVGDFENDLGVRIRDLEHFDYAGTFV